MLKENKNQSSENFYVLSVSKNALKIFGGAISI